MTIIWYRYAKLGRNVSVLVSETNSAGDISCPKGESCRHRDVRVEGVPYGCSLHEMQTSQNPPIYHCLGGLFCDVYTPPE